MRQGIQQMLIGSQPLLQLSDEGFAEVRDALATLSRLLDIEQKLNLLLMNYLELENALVHIATRRMIFGDAGAEDPIDGPIHEAVRRLANLLTTCRSYTDQVPHVVSSQFQSKGSEYAECIKAFSDEYDTRLGYRVLWPLRNYVQHQGSGPSMFSSGSRILNIAPGPRLWEFHCTFSIKIEELTAIRGIKPTVIAEAKAYAEAQAADSPFSEKNRTIVNLLPLIRDYVTGICRAHERIREIFRQSADAAELRVERAVADFIELARGGERAPDGRLYGLALVRSDTQGNPIEEHSIWRGTIELRKRFDRPISDFTKSFATTLPRPDPPPY